MNVTYTGKHGDLPAEHQRKLDAKFAKLSKLIGSKGDDKQAHVIVNTERHLTNAKLTINYYDKQMVGQVAANIRALRKPDPYKNKGVRYTGEVLRKKAGKTGAGAKTK